MSESAATLESEPGDIWRPRRPLAIYFGAVAILFVLRLVLGFVAVPPLASQILSILSTAIFIVTPIYALLCAAAYRWKTSTAWLLTGAGALLHGGMFLLMRSVRLDPVAGLLAQNGMQVGMLFWTAGLGVLVAILIREKNMLLPVALFLAGLDAFLILMPYTPQAQIVAQNPEIVGNLGLRIPAVKSTVPGERQLPVGVQDLGFVGPADLFISAMFFAALFRYRMRPRETAIWLAPVLLGYLFVVLVSGMALPALVPIGLTVLIVNWREFTMSREEKQATGLVLLIALALAGYGLYARLTYKPPASPVESLPLDSDPSTPALGPPPEPGWPDPNR